MGYEIPYNFLEALMENYIELEQLLFGSCPALELRHDEMLSDHTSFRIGGPAPLMAFPRTMEEVGACVRSAWGLGVRMEVIGKGTNFLAADAGVNAFFLNTGLLTQMELSGNQSITVQGGAPLSRVALFAAQNSLTGLEFAHGIPGSLGGAVAMNAGAYDGEMAAVTVTTDYLTQAGEHHSVSGKAHEFGYRRSVFTDKRRIIISSVLQLKPGQEQVIRARMSELAARRKQSQPLEYPSAGSMFKRPPGQYAGTLIDQCGLKGRAVGGAQVSEKHAGFIVNRGGATCADVLELVRQVKSTVQEKTGVALEMEVKVIR